MANKDNKHVSKGLHILEKYRKNNNLTQKEFCKLININKNTYSQWKNGVNPSLNSIDKIKKIIPEITEKSFLEPHIEKFDINDKFWNKIYNDDALNVLKKIPDNSIHLVITSPPYNAGHNYDGYNDNLSWIEYKTFMKKIITEIYRILTIGGRLAINIPFAVKNKKTKDVKFLSVLFASICDELGFINFEFITWHKGKNQDHFQGNNTAWGSWKSPSNPVFRPLGEIIMVFSKQQTRLVGNKNKIDITSDEFKEWTKNIWYIVNNQSKKEHPCPYPDELVKRLIKLYSYKDNIVLDPFNGIGTTTIVASKLGRRYIGIEQSKKYCEIAKNNLTKRRSSYDKS